MTPDGGPTSIDDALAAWTDARTYSASAYSEERLAAAKRGRQVSVLLPAREVGSTIGPIVEQTVRLRERGLIEEIVVIDAASADGTASVAAGAGADVYQRDEILTDHGPCRGKGDALWRGLAVTTGEIVVMLDSDTRNFDASFARGLLGPLLEDDELQLVKGSFARPLSLAGIDAEGEGGRVTELVARPLINLFFPELAGFVQPLAGEVAARRTLLNALSFPVGYGVEIAMLIDALRTAGLDALGQVDLGRREDRSKSLGDLVPMAASVLATGLRRAGIDPGELSGPSELAVLSPAGPRRHRISTIERPPLRTLSSRNP